MIMIIAHHLKIPLFKAPFEEETDGLRVVQELRLIYEQLSDALVQRGLWDHVSVRTAKHRDEDPPPIYDLGGTRVIE